MLIDYYEFLNRKLASKHGCEIDGLIVFVQLAWRQVRQVTICLAKVRVRLGGSMLNKYQPQY